MYRPTGKTQQTGLLLLICALAGSIATTPAWALRSPLQAEPTPPPKDEKPKPVDPRQVTEDENGKIKIDPALQKRIDELLQRQGRTPGHRRGPNQPRPGANRPGANRPGVNRPGVNRPGDVRSGVHRPGPVRRGPGRPGADEGEADQSGHEPSPHRGRTTTRRTPPQPPGKQDAAAQEPGAAQSDDTTSLNIPPTDELVPPEDRTYRFSIKDGTFEQLVEGFARQTGLGVLGDAPRDGKVTFVTTEELTFKEALARVRMLLFNYKPHEPYWIMREDMNLRVIRVTDLYRILPKNRMFQSVEQLQAANLEPDDLALVIFTPKTGSVASLKLVRDFMPDYVRVSPLEDQNRVTIFALKKDIDKYLDLINFFEGKGSDPRSMEKIFVKHLLPSDAVAKLNSLMDLSTDDSAGAARSTRRIRGATRDTGAASLDVLPEPEITIIPEDPQGYILVRAMPATIDEIKELMPWIDVEDPIITDDPVIIPVKHVDPQDLVDMLQQILAADAAANTGATVPGTTKTTSRSRSRVSRRSRTPTAATSADLTLFAHPTMNAIIAFGDEASVKRVRELVTKFDVASHVGPERIPLEHADADTVISAVTAVLGSTEKGKPVQPNFTLIPDPVGDAVWYSGSDRDLEQVKAMIASLDVVEAKPVLHVVDLKNALPSFVAGILQQYEGDATAPTRVSHRRGRRSKTIAGKAKPEVAVAKFTPDDDAKQLYILCTDDEWAEFEPLIKQLDRITDDNPPYERIELAHIDGDTALEQLTPMIGDVGLDVRWAALDHAIMVIGADAQLIAEVRQFLSEIDKPSKILQRTFEIQYADPMEIKSAIEALVAQQGGGGVRVSARRPKVEGKTAIAVPTVTDNLTIVQIGNRLVVRAAADDLDQIAALVTEFDVPTDEPELRSYGDFPAGTDMVSIAETMRTIMTGSRPTGRRRRTGVAEDANDPRFIPQPTSGKLVVVAQPSDFDEIEELLNMLRSDVEIDKVEVAYITLQYADPAEVIEAVEPLLSMQIRQMTATGELAEAPDGAGATPGVKRVATRRVASGRASERYYLVPDLRDNRVVIAAPAKIIELAKSMIAEFDTPAKDTEDVFRTVELENADPAAMVQSIQELMGAPSRRRLARSPAGKPGMPGTSAPTEAPLAVTVAPGGSAIVLNGPKDEVEQAVEWIQHLDEMSTHGRVIRVFSVEYADLHRLVDLVMNVVDAPEQAQGSPRRPSRSRRRSTGSSKQDTQDEAEAFQPTQTFVGSQVYVQADFVAHTMLVATTESRMVEVEKIVKDFNVAPENGGGAMARSEIPSFVYDLKYADAMDASFNLDSLLSQMWQPSDEVPQVESALFGNALIIKYPDASRFDEIRKLIADYIDKLTEDEAKIVRTPIRAPEGINAEELALFLQGKHGDYDIQVHDVTEPTTDYGVPVLGPYRPTQPRANGGHGQSDGASRDNSRPNGSVKCALPTAIDVAVARALASSALGQTPQPNVPEPKKPEFKKAAPERPEPQEPEPQEPEPQEPAQQDQDEADDIMPDLIDNVYPEQAAPTPTKTAGSSKSGDEQESGHEKKKRPKGEKLNIYYNKNAGTIVVEGPAILTDEVNSWVDDIREELKDTTVKPDIRMYRVRHIDVNTAKDILEEMFNATRQQRQMVQQQQRAAQQRMRQIQQQQQRQQQNKGPDQQGRPGQQKPEQPQAPQVPQLPAESVRIYPNERDRALIIRADTSQFPIIEELLATIDRPKPIDSDMKIFKLDRLNAADVEALLTDLLGLDEATKNAAARRTTRRSARGGAGAVSSGPGAQLPATIMQDIAGGTGKLGIDPDDISISANEQTNSIVVMAPSAAIDYIGGIIDRLQSEDVPERIAKYYELKYASAGDLATFLGDHFAQKAGGKAAPSGPARRGTSGSTGGGGSFNSPSFSAYTPLNQLIVQATEEQIKEIDDIVARFDVPGDDMKWEDVTLTRTDAATMADTLTQLYGQQGGGARAPRGRGQTGDASAPGARFYGDEGGRVLFMSVPASMHEQVMGTIKEIEASTEDRTKLRFIELEYATPSKVADAITEALDDGASRGRRGNATPRFTITPADGLKRLFVRADDEQYKEIESLATTLDTPNAIGFEFRVYPLKYADAKKVHETMTKLMTDYIRRLGSAAKGMEAFSVDVDEAANALVVLGSPAIFGFLEENLPKIDNPANAKSPPGFLMVTLRAADAQEVATNINRLWNGKQLAAGETPPQAESNRSTNTLIVRGTQAQVDEIKKQFVDPLEEIKTAATEMRIYPLKYADPNGVVNIINQWSKGRSPGNKGLAAGDVVTAVAEGATQSVVVNASAENHEIIKKMIDGLDNEEVAANQRKREVMTLSYANAQEIANQFTQVFRNTGKMRRGDPGPAFVGDAKTNSVIAYVNDEEMAEVKSLLAKIDIEPELGTERATVVYPLKYADPGALNNVVLNMFRWDRGTQPSPSEQVTSAVEWATQSLIVTASTKNQDIVKKLVDQVDVESTTSQELRVYKLKKATADEVARALQGAYRAKHATRRGEQAAVITPEPATNTLIVSANDKEHAEIAKLVAQLDVESEADRNQQVHVVQLAHADPDAVSRTLNDIFVRSAQRRGSQATPISISAVQNAKAILIKCDDEDFADISAVLKDVDSEDTVIGGETRLVSLTYGDATEIHKALEASLAKQGGRGHELVGNVRLSALPQSNAILVTGTKEDVDRIEAQVKAMDAAGEKGAVPQVITLKHANVAQVVPALQDLFTQQRGRSRGGNREQPVITANEPNMLLVRANPTDFAAIENVVAKLDTEEQAAKPNFKIIQIAQGVNIADLAGTVEQGVNNGAQAQAPTGRGAKIPSITVEPDLRTGSLIVSGSPTLFDDAERLARELEKLGPSGGKSVVFVRPTKLKIEDIQRVIDQLTGVQGTSGGRASPVRRPTSRSSPRRPATRPRRPTPSRPRRP